MRDFNYYTASMENRHDFIIDSDSDEDNDCEQSDIVSIMINLAYIKKEIARKK